MIAEIGDCRERYPDYRALAADAGQAPGAVESGTSRDADIDNRARARGAGHAHATRVLGRAWSQINWRSGTTTTPTTPNATPPSNASSRPEVDTGAGG